MKMIAKRRAVHEKEVEIIEKAHEEEKAKKEAALEKYHETIQRIEEKYEKDKSELSLLKKRKIKKIIEETGDDSDLLAQKLSDQFGFDVVYDEEEETKQ